MHGLLGIHGRRTLHVLGREHRRRRGGLGDLDSDGCADFGFTIAESLHTEHGDPLAQRQFGFEGPLRSRRTPPVAAVTRGRLRPGLRRPAGFRRSRRRWHSRRHRRSAWRRSGRVHRNRVIVVSGRTAARCSECRAAKSAARPRVAWPVRGTRTEMARRTCWWAAPGRDEVRIVISGRFTGCTLQLVERRTRLVLPAGRSPRSVTPMVTRRSRHRHRRTSFQIFCRAQRRPAGRLSAFEAALVRNSFDSMASARRGAFDGGFMLGIRACAPAAGGRWGRTGRCAPRRRSLLRLQQLLAPDRILVVGLPRR